MSVNFLTTKQPQQYGRYTGAPTSQQLARYFYLDNTDLSLIRKTRKVNTQLIVEHWDDLLRVAGSLKFGALSASELLRALQDHRRPSTLARSIGELGRIAKTLYLLDYINDEAYRRRILIQLNRGEGRHKLARAVCYGKRGEIRKAYREGTDLIIFKTCTKISVPKALARCRLINR